MGGNCSQQYYENGKCYYLSDKDKCSFQAGNDLVLFIKKVLAIILSIVLVISGYALNVSDPTKNNGLKFSVLVIFVLWSIIIFSLISNIIQKANVLNRATPCPSPSPTVLK